MPRILQILDREEVQPTISVQTFGLYGFVCCAFQKRKAFYFAFRYTQYNMEENTMNKSFKKILSIVLSVMMIASLMTVSLSVSAVEDGKVRVIVRNDTYSVENGAPWDGVLVDEWVSINNDTTMMSAVVDALNNHGYTQEGAESNYISSINGLAAFDGGTMSGWMGTLNDWFTNSGYASYTVADGTLESGDEIGCKVDR